MKIRIIPMLLASVLVLAWTQAPAQDGAALYKTRCAGCHGDHGQGKAPVGPKLAGTQKSATEIEAVVTKGGEPKPPHVKAMSSVTADQATSVAAYVKTLK